VALVNNAAGSSSTLHLAEPSVQCGAQESRLDADGLPAGSHDESVETGTPSRPASISGQSIRSLKALEAAELLNTVADEIPQEGFTNDMCAICLDEFADGEEIRTLPCHHEFHCECIGKHICSTFMLDSKKM